MANNPVLFNAVMSGVFSGINSTRSIRSVIGADYATGVANANAFATLLDAAIVAGAYSQADADMLSGIVQQVVNGKGSAGLNMTSINAIIAAFNAARAVMVPGASFSQQPLPKAYYVSPDTLVPLASQTGFIGTPFATIQAAYNAALAAGGDITLLIDNSVAGPGNLIATSVVRIRGIGFQAGTTLGTINSNSNVLLQDIATGAINLTGAAALECFHCTLGAVTGVGSSLIMIDTIADGPIAVGSVYGIDAEINNTVTTDGGDIACINTPFFSSITALTGIIDLTNCTQVEVAGSILATLGDIIINGGHYAHDITATLSSAATQINGAVFSGGTHTFLNVAYNNCPRLPAMNSADVQISNSLLGVNPTATTLLIDSISYKRARVAAISFAGVGAITVSDSMAVTLSIVVPAVIAGAVGYVNTNLPASLQFLAVDAPMLINPQADLVAAGAGGGFINARVIDTAGTKQLRSAFVGALAGGAADFTVVPLI